MTLNGKPSKDKWKNRKGGYCQYCNCVIKEFYSHDKTFKHIINYWEKKGGIYFSLD
jgi:hypothetical protein